jgi:hypothetical protein
MGAKRLWICHQESFAAVFRILPVNGKRVTVTLPRIQSGIHRANHKQKLIPSKHPREAPNGSKLRLVCESRLHNDCSARCGVVLSPPKSFTFPLISTLPVPTLLHRTPLRVALFSFDFPPSCRYGIITLRCQDALIHGRSKPQFASRGIIAISSFIALTHRAS